MDLQGNPTQPVDYHTHDGVNSPKIDKTANGIGAGKTVCFWPVGGYQVGSGSTAYLNCGSVQSTTESAVQIQVPFAGSISNLYVTTYSSQPASGNMLLTFRKNGSSQTVVVTIAANASAGFFSDTTNSFTVAAGDKICVQATNNASGNSANIMGLSFQLTSS